MLFVGLDVHYRSSTLCILNASGKVVKQMRVQGHWPAVIAVLEALRRPLAMCYEASCGYGALHDRLRQVAKRVVVAHPGQLRLIFKSKKKSDRVDAKKLAMLLLMDQVPQVYVPSADVRQWRSLIEFRHRLVGKRTRVKNGLRALLRGQGVVYPRGKALWTRKGRAWLAALELPGETIALQRDLLFEELTSLDTQIGRVEKVLNTIADRHPGVVLLRTIPGVGARTGEAVAAYIADPSRFARNKVVGSYFGLVPCQTQSADRNRLGHITRQGPATVRKLLVEAAWQGVRRSPTIRAYFNRVQGGDSQRKKIALVATAHYLLRVMLALLVTGESWQEDPRQKSAA
jgi:transposase